jgi:hypothetical protein
VCFHVRQELASLGAERVIQVLRDISAPPAERSAAAAAMLAHMHSSREAAIAMCAAAAAAASGGPQSTSASATKSAAPVAVATPPASASLAPPPPVPPRAPKLSADDERVDLRTCSAAHAYRRWQALHGTRFAVAFAFRGARVNVLEAVRVPPRAEEDARMRPGEFYFDKAAQVLSRSQHSAHFWDTLLSVPMSSQCRLNSLCSLDAF